MHDSKLLTTNINRETFLQENSEANSLEFLEKLKNVHLQHMQSDVFKMLKIFKTHNIVQPVTIG